MGNIPIPPRELARFRSKSVESCPGSLMNSTNSNNTSKSMHRKQKSVHENLVRQRDRHSNIEDIYIIGEQIGQGGLCSIYKIRKKDDQIGGSSRPNNARKGKIFGASPRTFRSKIARKSLAHTDQDGYPMFFALKVINLTMVKEDKIDQLRNEVEILKTLDHMNIIKAYETFQVRKSRKLMIVMELCTGGDLYARLPYTESQAAHVTKQVLSAVSYMHAQNIIHRDLKFENIIFESTDPASPIKVIDFGLSKEYTNRDHHMIERVGTLYSMSPETMQGSYDEKADLWSIGVCTYMMLANGSKPFEGTTPKEMVARVLAGTYNFDGEIWHSISEAARDFIRQLLQVNPTLRPSASQAWKQEWIKEYSRSSLDDEGIDEEFRDIVRDCLARYVDAGPFRKLALNVIAKRSTPNEIFKLRKVFSSFDTLNTGTISLDQFRAALSSSKYSDEDLRKMFYSVDVNKNNVINYTEFLAACLEAQGELEEHRLAEAFDLIDSDDSGYISRENLRQILGKNRDDKSIDALIAEADVDRNGRISYQEFLQLFAQQNRRRVSKIYEGTVQSNENLVSSVASNEKDNSLPSSYDNLSELGGIVI